MTTETLHDCSHRVHAFLTGGLDAHDHTMDLLSKFNLQNFVRVVISAPEL